MKMTIVRPAVARGLEFMARAMAVLAAIAMTGIVAIIVSSVVMRRFANSPLHITEDAVGLMLSAVLFLGVPYVTLHSKHVRVTVLVQAVGSRWKPVLAVSATLVGLAFFGWIFVESIPWFEFAWKRNLKTETARILLYPWMVVLPLSIGLTWLIFLARLFRLIESDREADEAVIPSPSQSRRDT